MLNTPNNYKLCAEYQDGEMHCVKRYRVARKDGWRMDVTIEHWPEQEHSKITFEMLGENAKF